MADRAAYPGPVPRAAAPAVRTVLVERAAEMLAAREPVTLRALVHGTGASTMAVYTHFGGMPGLWRAVRQEGFARLAARLATVPRTEDPVRDLVALGAAYAANALAHPHLFQAMFDPRFDLDDAPAAAATFEELVSCAERARRDGRLTADPRELATRFWAVGHGLLVLLATGMLPAEALDTHLPPTVEALLVAAGDEPDRCRRSVHAGWPADLPTAAT